MGSPDSRTVRVESVVVVTAAQGKTAGQGVGTGAPRDGLHGSRPRQAGLQLCGSSSLRVTAMLPTEVRLTLEADWCDVTVLDNKGHTYSAKILKGHFFKEIIT